MDLRTLGEQCHDAIVVAAKYKDIAVGLRKKCELIFDMVFLVSEGAIETRKALARTSKEYREADERALEAETKAVIAKAEALGLDKRFDEWRNEEEQVAVFKIAFPLTALDVGQEIGS